jgi:hypothetical protein
MGSTKADDLHKPPDVRQLAMLDGAVASRRHRPRRPLRCAFISIAIAAGIAAAIAASGATSSSSPADWVRAVHARGDPERTRPAP